MTTSMHRAQAQAARLARWPQRRLAHIPGDYGAPVIGHTLAFLRDFGGLMTRRAAQYGPVFRSNILFQRTVTLLGPEANEFLLRDTEHMLSSRAAWSPVLDRLFTDGLMLRDFADHKFHRRIMQQAFKKPALAGYMERMNPHIAQALPNWPTGRSFRFLDQVKALLLDVGAEIFLGLEMGPETARVNQAFVDEVDASLALLRLPIPGTKWHRGLRARRYLERFITELIATRRKGGTDFFSELCRAAAEDADAQLTDTDVMNHIIFLLFAAHDTTTSTLCSIIYALAQHPQWQARLRAEFQSLGTDTITHADLERLPQASWVFREALRMHPPLPTIPRRTVAETSWQGYRLPANTHVHIVPLHTHYMPEYWSEPHRFDPERFSPERAEDKQHPFLWVPFGGGHHKCIGLHFAALQSTTFLFHFLRRFEVSVPAGYRMPALQVPLAMPGDGLPVTLRAL
ncbi:cytochrome P450 [Alcanivorax quisquiliarum]|uniref:Cytochrome P450 n=1 Tax=Alcanivorax quisquiliarum TaxID=2933565 RepID=A0ABT0E8E9_9GAMM|nr:cytochrome P450 [Alcanivorax quisquiliarum]MCK0538117.1 cytochrome P450 [Alcanivorax quisquiliarum]